MTLLTNPAGGGLEPVEHHPASPDMSGDWGHLGPFDFGIGVRHLGGALDHLAAQGIELRSEPQIVELGEGATWSYAYIADPDGTYVSVNEARY
jgi:hypothetical protein